MGGTSADVGHEKWYDSSPTWRRSLWISKWPMFHTLMATIESTVDKHNKAEAAHSSCIEAQR